MRAWTLFPLAAAVVAAGAAVARQDDAPKKKFYEMSPAEQAAAQMRMMSLIQPGPEHDVLTKYAGDFDLTIEIWMAPGAEPMTIEGEAKNEAVLEGRFLRAYQTSTFPPIGETESISYFGFDRRHERYTVVGFDTLGTYYVTATGERADDGRIVLRGTDEDPEIGTQTFEYVLSFPDDDTMVTTLYFHDMFQEGPFKMMEQTARRRR